MEVAGPSAPCSTHERLALSNLPLDDYNTLSCKVYNETLKASNWALQSRKQNVVAPEQPSVPNHHDWHNVEPAFIQQELNLNQLHQNAHDTVDSLPDAQSWNESTLVYRSREPSVIAAERPKYPSTQDWENIKPIFTKLYSTDNRALKDVKTILEKNYDFVATERMYKGRINAWNLHKNLKKAEKATLIRKVRQKRRPNPPLFKGRPVQMHRLLRYCKENKVPTSGLEAVVRRGGQRRMTSLVDVSSGAESETYNLQSLFRTPSPPARPIAIHGDMRTAELIIWTNEVYLKEYFTTGLGTYYFKPELTIAALNGRPTQASVSTKNEEAWDRVVDPLSMIKHITDAFCALQSGFAQLAFTTVSEAFDLLETFFKQQTPILLPCLICVFENRTRGESDFSRHVRQFILSMGTTVLGSAHPLLVILNSLCTISSTNGKMFAWRVVTDSFSKFFDVLKIPGMLLYLRLFYIDGLRGRGWVQEGQDYLEAVCSPEEEIEGQNVDYILVKAILLRKQHKFIEAEVEYRRCLELLEGAGCDILANGLPSKLLSRWHYLDVCLFGLGRILKATGRIDEGQAMYRGYIELVCAAYGPDSVETQVATSAFDDFLVENGYIEESAALRAQYPFLLGRYGDEGRLGDSQGNRQRITLHLLVSNTN
ncbi:hypothetical protein EPUS_02205 [Endocarpon pusillum Z07020]|uniref:Clr5 domain-containing protein n=1 Tax=Endocarpon pusillum (strain Z07020 / HMAS-L-300199) TaxID=1263415 RepID=U1GJI8_ENDPU|nr:uncharacterized protein EPUS_02205 [Endocarpon pusillum Z07020]ERF72318.1 hypothetical protein EPUS_02205 [Endocarpon pusillum Z07020]